MRAASSSHINAASLTRLTVLIFVFHNQSVMSSIIIVVHLRRKPNGFPLRLALKLTVNTRSKTSCLEVPPKSWSLQFISSRKSRHPSMVTPFKWEDKVFVCVSVIVQQAVVAYQVRISPVVIRRNLQGVRNNGQFDEFCLNFLEI